MVYFLDDISATDLAQRTAAARSTLMAFFKYNTLYEDGRPYLYTDFLA
jgi:hypothetical protein